MQYGKIILTYSHLSRLCPVQVGQYGNIVLHW